MKNIQIRPAVKEDCPAIMALIYELALYEKAPEQFTLTLEEFEADGFGAKAAWEAWVAINETEQIVGFSLCYMRYSTWKGKRLYLEDLIVTESARGMGIGRLLMDNLIEICKERKYSGMVWQVLDWNEPAINFYKKYDAKLDGEWVNCSLTFDGVL